MTETTLPQYTGQPTIVGGCTCEQADPGGIDPGCNTHGSHPCANGSRHPHEPTDHGCCAHCLHLAPRRTA